MLEVLHSKAERPQERRRTHLVVLDDPDVTLTAVRELRGRGYDVHDVHSPFPLHGIEEALELPPTRLPWGTFIGGALGVGLACYFQIWTHGTDWPLIIGGKTDVALPALVPVMFEVTVLLAAFGTVFTLLLRRGLLPTLRSGTPPSQPQPEVTDDQFVLVVRENDGTFSFSEFERACSEYRPRRIVEAWRVE